MKKLSLFLSLVPTAFGQLLVNDPANTAVNAAIKANEAVSQNSRVTLEPGMFVV